MLDIDDEDDEEHAQVLMETIAPEFNFTGVDLFTAVSQVLSYIDAFPVLRSDGVLDFEYLNDLSNEEIDDLEMVDRKVSLNETNFSNRLVANYQNAKQETAINYPGKNLYRKIGASNYGVVDKNDYWFITDKTIDYIDKLIIKHQENTNWNFSNLYFQSDATVLHSLYFENFPIETYIDITAAVYEKEIYESLPYEYANSSFPNRNNTLYYSKGDNKIYAGITGEITYQGQHDVLEYAMRYCLLREYGFGTEYDMYNFDLFEYPTDFKKNCKYNVSYHAIFDGRISQESTSNKYEGETTVAQENSGVELNRMGNNMQGLIAKLGNEQLTITMPITEMKDRVKVGTLWVDEQGSKWFVNQVKTEFTTSKDKVIINATLTKDFNMISQFTRLNQEKRFYEISTKLTSKGYENLNEFIYFTNRELSDISTLAGRAAMTTDFYLLLLSNTLIGTNVLALAGDDLEKSTKLVEYVECGCKETSESETAILSAIPIHTYGSGNSICFEMGFESPINAGNRVVNNVNRTTLYTNDSGFADNVSLTAWTYKDEPRELDDNFPRYENISSKIALFSISNFYYYKKPNEILHVNYSVNFLPYFAKTTDALGTNSYVYDEIYFGDEFVNNNAIIPNSKKGNDVPLRKLYVYRSTTERYSIVDTKALGTRFTNPANIIINIQALSNNAFKGEIICKDSTTNISLVGYKSWCIADEDGNIYIAVNTSANSYDYAKIDWFSSRFRKV